MNRDDQHLSIEQVELLNDLARGGADADRPGIRIEDLRLHLAGCEKCQRLVSMDKEVVRLLGTISQDARAGGSAECVPVASLYDLAAGIAEGDKAEEAIKHATECDACGAILRQAAEDLADGPTHEESEIIRSLETSKPAWQKMLAGRLASLSGKRRNAQCEAPAAERTRKLSLSWRWIYALAGVLLAFAIVEGVRTWHSRPEYADRLLADAYTARRTLEFRIPGARFAPTRLTRGGEASSFERPPALLEAESIIGRSVEKQPENTAWLQARARAELLDGNYQAAIDTLNRTLELKPDDASLSTDLASAYAQRGEGQRDPSDYARAVEILGRVLVKQPNDPIALYNRAIASERLFLFSQAISDCEQYLRNDSNGDWADDVRRRLTVLQERQREKEKKSSSQLLSPSDLVRAFSLDPAQTQAAVEERPEDYIDVTIRSWLPRILSSRTGEPTNTYSEKAAIRIVSETLKNKHKDSWLADLISGSAMPGFARALGDLTRTMNARDTGDYANALQFATRSAEEFRAVGNVAGAIRAREEGVFALHLSRDGEKCLAAAAAMSDELVQHRYLWLKAQFELEQGVCEMMMGQFEGARRSIDDSAALAKTGQFQSLYLRALGISSDLASTLGDTREGWRRACAGLEAYWSGSFRPMIGYNFYTDMDSAAEVRGQAHVQVAIWREALQIIDADSDILLRAMAHSWMAKAAYAAEMSDMAEKEFARASLLFASAPQSQSTLNDRVESEIALARVEADRGNRDAALARLDHLRAEMNRLSNRYVAIRFYAAIGSLELRAGRLDAAEHSLHAGVALAESGLHSFDSAREAMLWKSEVADAYRNLVELSLTRGDTQSALEIWEWYRGAPLRSGSRKEVADGELTPAVLAEGPALPDIHKVAESIPGYKNVTVISFAVLPERLIIWVYDDRGEFERSSIVSRTHLERLAKRFDKLCADPNSDQTALRRDGRELYQMMIKPVESLLAEKRSILFELDEPLEQVPLEALVDREGRFLLDRGPIALSPSIYHRGPARRSEGISSRMSSLVVAVTGGLNSKEGELLPLSDVKREAENVASHFEGPRVLEDAQATLPAVRSVLSTVEIFHFSGHAMILPVQGLVLGGNNLRGETELLKADELDSQSLKKMQLVVLSACGTSIRDPEGFATSDGLEFAFLRAGVPRIVGSRWSVDSVSTSALMSGFYGALISGRDVAEAMRVAQLELRGHREWSHPYFWASFRVVKTA